MNRFLIVKLGALGDVVHAIPVAAALRRAYPAARIDWLVSAKHRELLELVPIIDTRLTLDEGSYLSSIRTLRSASYDVALDLQGLIKSGLIARSSGARRVIGFSGRYSREPLARLFYTDVFDPGGAGMYDFSETRHVVTINLGLLGALGITPAKAEFPFRDVDSVVAREVVERTGGRFVLLNPGAAWPNKRWPPSRFGAVAAALHERHGLKSAVLWGPDERTLADEVVAASQGAAIATPKTSIGDIVAIARSALLMLSGDTGPTHIATAVGTPIVGLFGPTRPERNGPWQPDDESVSRAAVCQCHHLRMCRVEKMCLLDVEVSEVLGAIERRLAAKQAHG